MNNVDSARLEQFRQVRKEIRGSKAYLIVGIDVAKNKHYAFFGTATGKTILKRLIFENSIKGIISFSTIWSVFMSPWTTEPLMRYMSKID